MGTTTTSPAKTEATPPTPAGASPTATDATSAAAPQSSPLKVRVLFPDDTDGNHRGFEITDPALIQQLISAIQATKPTKSFIGDVQGYEGPIDAEKLGKVFAQFSGGGGTASAGAAPTADQKAGGTPVADPKASGAPAPAAQAAKADTATAAPTPAAAKPADQPKTDATAAKPADAQPAPAAPTPAKT